MWQFQVSLVRMARNSNWLQAPIPLYPVARYRLEFNSIKISLYLIKPRQQPVNLNMMNLVNTMGDNDVAVE